jgi:sortase A
VWAERAAWTIGILALGVWAAIDLSATMSARRAVKHFTAFQAGLSIPSSPDRRLWSPERVRAWEETMNREAPAALAILRIPRIGVEVPVLEGTDDWTLNRAVGHIEDTARPGAAGNSGIAGHRDGFFRALKTIQDGDEIDLETLSGTVVYHVSRTWIVNPEDVSVLDATDTPALTLVTCYPFYFVGSAPQRFIVRAVRTTRVPPRTPSV